MKRQPPGSGSIKKYRNGYRLVVCQDGKYLNGPTVEKRSDARAAWEEKYHVARKPGQLTTLTDSFQALLRSSWFQGKSPTTRELERPILERFAAYYSTARLYEINKDHVINYRSTISKAPRTVNREINAIRSALSQLGNKIDPIKPLAAPDKRANWFTPKFESEFLGFARDNFPDYLHTAVLIGLRAGLRRGEICGLCHEDRDEEGINVSRNVIEGDEGMQIKRPKNAKGESWIPLHEDLKPIVGHGRGLVIKTSNGTPIRPRNLSRSLRNATEGTKFEKITFHDLRRTFAMSLLELGVDVRTASDITRHDPKVLLNEYTKSRRDLKLEAMQKLTNRATQGQPPAKKAS